MTTFGAVDTEDTLFRVVPVDVADIRKGSTAPTDVTIGTTPVVAALLFDATAELASLNIVMSPDWDKAQDVSVVLVFALVNAQSDAEVLSVTFDYIRVKKDTTAEGVAAARTSTQVLATKAVATATGLAVGDVYLLTATLDKDDANNGWAADDDTVMIVAEFHLTNLTGVAAMHVLGARLLYESNY